MSQENSKKRKASSLDERHYSTLDEKVSYMKKCKFQHVNGVDKYVKSGILGNGTYGVVHKASQKGVPTNVVAIKTLNIESPTEGIPITVLREIKIMQQLKHQNVVNLIEVCNGMPEGNKKWATFHIVMEYCEHNLGEIIRNSALRIQLPHKKSIMSQILHGLFYLHSNNILHRDLKPHNILVNKEGCIKICDLGLSRPISSLNRQRLTPVVITQWYRPPELLLGKIIYSKEVDMWSVGCIMAELWTTSPILKSDTEQSQLLAILRLCGPITSESMPEAKNLPLFSKLLLPITTTNTKNQIRNRFSYIMDNNTHALDLLERFLTLNPANRIDVKNALAHKFFRTEPSPQPFKEELKKLNVRDITDYASKLIKPSYKY